MGRKQRPSDISIVKQQTSAILTALAYILDNSGNEDTVRITAIRAMGHAESIYGKYIQKLEEKIKR